MATTTCADISFHIEMPGEHSKEELEKDWQKWFKIRKMEARLLEAKITDVVKTPSKENPEIRSMNFYKKIISNIIGKEYKIYFLGGNFSFSIWKEKEGETKWQSQYRDIKVIFKNEQILINEKYVETGLLYKTLSFDLSDPDFNTKFLEAFKSCWNLAHA